MENFTIEHLASFVEAHRYTGYLILFLSMVFEGEAFLIIAGTLATLGAFDLFDVFWIALMGVVIGNMSWYYLGVFLKRKNFSQGMLVQAEKVIMYFLPRFREKPFSSIFLSKFIYGANHATVIMSGALRVSFELFLKAELLASVLWVALFVAIGHFFGYAAIHVTRNAMRFALLLVVFVVMFILLQRTLTYYYERRKHHDLEKDSDAQR